MSFLYPAFLVGALAVSLVVRSTDWLHRPRFGPIALLTAGAILYTLESERRNLAAGAWSYSERMPVVPGIGAGLVPIAQWLLLSPLSVLLAARLSREDSE